LLVSGIRANIEQAEQTGPKETTQMMKTYTINTDLNITAYESNKDAFGTGLPVFSSAKDLGAELAKMNVKPTDLWNSLPGLVPVKKFMNREAGLKRIFAQLQSLVPVPVGGGQDEGETVTPRKAAKKAHAPEAIRETLEAFVGATAKQLKRAATKKAAAKAAKKRESADAVVADIKAKDAKKKAAQANGPREGSKEALVVALLSRKGGVTRAEVAKATGWLEHSVGGFMSGTAKTKLGLPVESYKTEKGERAYRLVGGAA
jgi:hypothetical protein